MSRCLHRSLAQDLIPDKIVEAAPKVEVRLLLLKMLGKFVLALN